MKFKLVITGYYINAKKKIVKTYFLISIKLVILFMYETLVITSDQRSVVASLFNMIS